MGVRRSQPTNGQAVVDPEIRQGSAWAGSGRGHQDETRSLAAELRAGSAPTELHGLAPEAVAARLAQPVVGKQLDRGRSAADTAPFDFGTRLGSGGVDREPSFDLDPCVFAIAALVEA